MSSDKRFKRTIVGNNQNEIDDFLTNVFGLIDEEFERSHLSTTQSPHRFKTSI